MTDIPEIKPDENIWDYFNRIVAHEYEKLEEQEKELKADQSPFTQPGQLFDRVLEAIGRYSDTEIIDKSIDTLRFDFDTPAEAKQKIKQLTHLKKELRQIKREVGFNGKIAAAEDYETEQFDRLKLTIDNLLLHLDKAKLEIDRWIFSHPGEIDRGK